MPCYIHGYYFMFYPIQIFCPIYILAVPYDYGLPVHIWAAYGLSIPIWAACTHTGWLICI